MQKIEEKYIERTSDGFAWTLRRAYRAAYGFGEKFDSVDQKGKLVRAVFHCQRDIASGIYFFKRYVSTVR